jgi:hypothetical protein
MVSALTNGAHMLYFCTINHGVFSFLSKTYSSWIYVVGNPEISAYIIQSTDRNVNCKGFKFQYGIIKKSRGGSLVLPLCHSERAAGESKNPHPLCRETDPSTSLHSAQDDMIFNAWSHNKTKGDGKIRPP